MGLDIEYWGKAERFEGEPDRNEVADQSREDSPQLVHAFVDAGFEASLRGLEEGWYECSGESGGFRAGSYSGYGEWRGRLSVCALAAEPEAVWADPDRFRNQPFFELVNFADNEGTIGPEAAADLFADFDANRDGVFAAYAEAWDDPDDISWFRSRYDNWREAFRVAAGGGLVKFT